MIVFQATNRFIDLLPSLDVHDESVPAGGAAASSLAKSCSEWALPAACIARTTAVLSQ